MPNLASQMRGAFASMALNTGSSSPGELLMTLSTSDGCGLLLQRLRKLAVRACTSSNSRAFSIAITAWSAKFFNQLNLLVGEWPDLGRRIVSAPIGVIFPQHGNGEHRPMPRFEARLALYRGTHAATSLIVDDATGARSTKARPATIRVAIGHSAKSTGIGP